ncbi:MAG: DUF5011 domain-containing protein [Terrisporobacter sp.]
MKKQKLKRIIAIGAIASIVIPNLLTSTVYANNFLTLENISKETKDFGVLKGIQWPKQVNSPYIDMVAWTSNPNYSNNGAANLAKISTETGVDFFNLGFIQSSGQGIKDGQVAWGWGGYSVLSEWDSENTQYNGIKKSIRELRELGGDVTISFGGLSGTAFWQVTQDVDILANTYKNIINGYGLTRIDLDIEGGAQNVSQNIANAKAIKKVQSETGVDVVLTLPVLPSGLTNVQLDVLQSYLSEGVDLEVINLMTMCYGSGTLNPGENYGTASLRAVDSTKNQLQDYYKKYAGISLNDDAAYAKIGTTPSIGYESGSHPIFTTELSKLIVDHAVEKKLAMTSFWSMNRDTMLQSNSGINSQYAFTNIFKVFGEDSGNITPDPGVNSKPIISGANDITIKLGESFDSKKGVTAIDIEDGDLTNKITITGTVDNTKEGIYKIVYKVTDSKGATSEIIRNVTVKSNDSETVNDTYDNSKVYTAGDTVIYNGKKYLCKWWVQGQAPGTTDAWLEII